jgi:sugar phosphate isomerase/epimerase
MPEWLQMLGTRLYHLHLHDNRGQADDHAPVGDGLIDFPLLFEILGSLPASPSMTLEAHSPENLLRSLTAVKTRFLTPP